MTLPLTRPPCGDAGHDASPPDSRRPPWWRGRRTCRGSGRARGSEAPVAGAGPAVAGRATSPGGAAALLAACALFACAVALFSTNPPERLWGMLAAGPYGRRGHRGAGRPASGPMIAVAVSLAGALIVPLAWMAWSGRGSRKSAWSSTRPGCSCTRGRPIRARTRVATAHNPYVYNPYLPALAVFGVPHALFGGGLLTDPRLWFGVVFVLGFAGTLALSGVSRPWLWTAVVSRLPGHRVPAQHGRRRPARAGPALPGPRPAAGQPDRPRPTLRGSSWPAWPWAWPRP